MADNNNDSSNGTPPAGDDNGEDAHRVIESQPGDLDAAHNRAVREFEKQDDAADEEPEKPKGDEDENTDKDKKSGEDEDKSTDKKTDDGKGDDEEPEKPKDKKPADDKTDEDESEDEPPAPEKTKLEEPEAPEAPDDDVAKPGKYKTKFVDDEGKEYHVTSIDQLPDDFEPRNQKEYGKSIMDLGKQQTQFEKDTEAYRDKKGEFDKQVVVESTVTGWKSEIAELTKNKELPADEKERNAEIVGTYKLMESEAKQGRRIQSWAHAHELYMARKTREDAAADKEKDTEAEKVKTDAKKDAGSKVMGGSGGGTAEPKNPAVRKAPPMGTSLDNVHQSVARGL